MRFMVVTHSQFPVPPDQAPAIMEGFAAWWERYRDRWQAAGFFVGGDGGGGICEVSSEAEFNQMMLEWPLNPYSKNEVYLLLDMDTALAQWQGSIGQGQSATAPGTRGATDEIDDLEEWHERLESDTDEPEKELAQ